MTQVTYNGITIQDVLTQSVDQQPIYDTAGDVDQIYVKTVVTVKFTFHTISGAGLGFSNGSELAGGIAPALKALTTHRRRFTMDIGGNTLFDIRPGATSGNVIVVGGKEFDVNSGPRPSLRIEEIIGVKVARGTFSVEFATPSCAGYSDGVISLRWWTSDEVDANWMTTRTINGRLRVATNNNQPHEFRHLIFPPLQRGFKRESMSFIEDPNGLELDFTIKDKEVYYAAPNPSTTWRGSHRMVSQVPGATVVESEMSVDLEGAHDIPQTKLIQLAVKIIDSKLQLEEQNVGSSGNAVAMIMFYAISASLHENKVQAICRIKHTGTGEDSFEFLPQAGKKLGKPLDSDVAVDAQYNPLVSRILPGPTAPLTTIIKRILQTPCNVTPMPNAGDAQPQGTTSDDTDTTTITTDVGELPPEDKGPQYDAKHRAAPYLAYRVLVQTWTTAGIAPMTFGVGDNAVTSGLKTVVAVSLTGGISYRHINVRAARYSQPPELFEPKATFIDAKGREHTLLKKGLGGAGQATDSRGATIYHAAQWMKYMVSASLSETEDGLRIPNSPWLKEGTQTTDLPPDIFTKDPLAE